MGCWRRLRIGFCTKAAMTVPQEMIAKPTTESDNQGTMGMWPSLATANFIYAWSNIFLVVGAAIGIVSTTLVIWMGNVKDEYLQLELAARASDAAHAEWQITLLKLDAKQLEADTAKANERAAEAQLELERYRAPRDLTESQLETLAVGLKQFPGTEFVLMGYPDVAESSQFVDRLAVGLDKAGWKRRDVPIRLAAGTAGVFVDWMGESPNAPKQAAEALAAALRSIGITAVARDERSNSYFWSPRNRNVLGVEVGTKH